MQLLLKDLKAVGIVSDGPQSEVGDIARTGQFCKAHRRASAWPIATARVSGRSSWTSADERAPCMASPPEGYGTPLKIVSGGQTDAIDRRVLLVQ